MSRLLELVRKATSVESRPLGFHTAAGAAPGARMLLVAERTVGKTASAVIKPVPGADAWLYRPATGVSLTKNLLEGWRQAAGGAPLGICHSGTNEKGRATASAEADFLVFGLDDSVGTLPEDDNHERIVEIDANISNAHIRALQATAADAVMLHIEKEEKTGLSWRRVLEVRRVSGLISKPLLLRLKTACSSAEIKALWQAGADCLVLAAPDDATLIQQVETMQSLGALPPRKQGSGAPILPKMVISADSGVEEAADDEEDY